MSEVEPRLDLAGNPLPPLPASAAQASAPTQYAPPGGPAPLPNPTYAPPPYGVNGPAPATSHSPATFSSVSDSGGGGAALKIGLIAAGVLLALIAAAIVMLTPKHTAAPTTFTTYTAADKSFSCSAPAGWTITAAPTGAKMSDGSASTVGGVLFQQNSASIDITTDTYTTLVAYDVVNNNADPQSLTGSKAGVLHKQWHKRIAAEHKGYTEKQIADFEGQMGDARLAEWTGAGNALGFGGSLHGYRASLTGGGKTAEVVCSCLESDWPTLKPAFQRLLVTFVAGGEAAPPDTSAPAPGGP